MNKVLTDTLHMISQALNIPCRIGLVILVVIALIEIGKAIMDYRFERKRRRLDCLSLMDSMRNASQSEKRDIIQKSGLDTCQKERLIKLNETEGSPREVRLATAQRLLADEDERNDRTMAASRLVSKLGPILGLMGTLIPLGPGIVALGHGDTQTLSQAMLTAFDTMVTGLVSAAVCFIILGIRKGWCTDSTVTMEALMECVLQEAEDDKK